jgi:L-ascorbate metabolism protein UlaG (beta-lactamase superfamily)
MGIEDAIRAAHMINTRTVVGVHYDTFEFIELDREEAMNAFHKNGLELKLPGIGETINL